MSELKYATGKQRSLAYWIDFLILISAIFVIGAIVWNTFPQSKLNVGDMISYRKSDFVNFFSTVGFSFVFTMIYVFLIPMTKIEKTFGQKLAGIKVCKENGEQTSFKNNFFRFIISSARFLSVTTLGPFMASFGKDIYWSVFKTPMNIAFTWFFLLVPVFIFSFMAFLAWKEKNGQGPLERFMGIVYISER